LLVARVKDNEAPDEQAPHPKLRQSYWWLEREAPRVMYGDEFIRLVRENLHPRFSYSNVRSNRFGVQSRRSVGMVAAGTIYCTDLKGMFNAMSVPAGAIPYTTRRPSLDDWDEDAARFKGKSQIVPGWRKMLSELVGSAYLRPSDKLSRLIGEDTKQLCPRRYQC
jgi:hypothetical protein